MLPDDFDWLKIVIVSAAAALGAHFAINIAHALVGALA